MIKENKIDLQLFTEGAEITSSTNTSNEDNNNDNSNDNSGHSESKPFAVFNDEKSFMDRLNRATRKGVNDLLTKLKFDKVEDLEKALTIYQQTEANKKSDLEKLADDISEYKKSVETANKQVKELQTQRTLEREAIKLGVKPDRLDYMMKLVDLNTINDSEDAQEQISKLLEIMPEFKAQIQESKKIPSKAGSQVNKGGKDDKAELTYDIIKNMSTAEAERRLDEITKFMNDNPLK